LGDAHILKTSFADRAMATLVLAVIGAIVVTLICPMLLCVVLHRIFPAMPLMGDWDT
jgi:uncharacterized membrane protein YeaQ/YmgE (transglycosylase-associated protein family)